MVVLALVGFEALAAGPAVLVLPHTATAAKVVDVVVVMRCSRVVGGDA
jgi:hypothetical protein